MKSLEEKSLKEILERAQNVWRELIPILPKKFQEILREVEDEINEGSNQNQAEIRL